MNKNEQQRMRCDWCKKDLKTVQLLLLEIMLGTWQCSRRVHCSNSHMCGDIQDFATLRLQSQNLKQVGVKGKAEMLFFRRQFVILLRGFKAQNIEVLSKANMIVV